jgi:signal transduction histidine kinase
MWSHRLNLFEIFKATTLGLLAVLLFSLGSTTHPTSISAYLLFSAIMLIQGIEMFAPALSWNTLNPAARTLLLRVSVLFQLVLASFLVAVTDGSGSIYELVYLLPIVSAATKLPGRDVALVVGAAVVAMIGFIVTGEALTPSIVRGKEFQDAVAAMVYFTMAGLLIYFFAEGERKQGKKYQDLAAALAESNNELTTAQAKLRERLDQITKMEERLQEISQMAVLGEMAGQIAHEVRNPLGIIKCSAEMLAARTKDTSTQRHIAVLLEETARVNKAVEGVLRLGAPLRMNKAPVNLSELLNSVIQLSSAWSLSPRVRIEVVAVPPEIIVAGDYDLLHQAFANLVRNACQAMPSGGVVSISSTIPADPRRLDISIADTGVGMAEKDLKRLGEPFFTMRRGGIGLGFSLARRVIVGHGGELQVTSKQGRGTNVLVSLPISLNMYAKQFTGAAGQGRD